MKFTVWGKSREATASKYKTAVTKMRMKEDGNGYCGYMKRDYENIKESEIAVAFEKEAYDGKDINALLDGLGEFRQYIMISLSAVYPKYGKQPFTEDWLKAENKLWGKYGTDKIDAEMALLGR